MARHLRIAAAQLGPVHLADTREAVVKRPVALMREAHSQGARFIVFPELALTTFFPRWCMEDQPRSTVGSPKHRRVAGHAAVSGRK